MITSRLFRTHFAIAALSIFGCVFLGTWLLDFVVHSIEEVQEKQHRQQRQPPLFYANFIEEFGAQDPIRGLQRFERLQGPNDPLRLSILNERGQLLYPPGGEVPTFERLPENAHEAIDLMPLDGTRHGFPALTVMRLNYDPPRFLLMKFRVASRSYNTRFFPLSFLVMSVMMLLGIAVALLMIFRSLREHVEAADKVIGELQQGNLKARFPIEREDEIGKAKARFNAMANEIERLVDRLRTAERSRNNLLQELAHDLRTPVASLQSIHESVFSSMKLAGDEAELAELRRKEADYMGHLVEDLLLLAQLNEPNYQPHKQPVEFLGLLEEEADSLALLKEGICLTKNFRVQEALVRGDEHLLRRLVRNSLENAFSFARSSVEVGADLDAGGFLRVTIRDDGPGFDAEALAKFGERRGQRMIHKTQGGRLSLGLGSVIMKSVIGLHRGKINAANTVSGGAFVEFTLPYTS